MKNILAICGSTRQYSTNLSLIKAVEKLSQDLFTITYSESIAHIPHYNPDMELERDRVESVLRFQKQIVAADGVLICTPEYAMGVPGALKNALDWTVSSGSFYSKPTALITASLSGQKGHAALMETLIVLGAIIPEESQLIISFANTKIDQYDQITSGDTLEAVKNLILNFYTIISQLK